MLKYLRGHKVKKTVFIILTVVIIFSFVLWGTVFFNEDKSQNIPSALATFDNNKIAVKDYLASYQASRHQWQLMFGDNFKMISSMVNLKGEAWDRLILLRYAEKERIKVKDSEIVQWIVNQPLFQRGGSFDNQYYKILIAKNLRMDSTRSFEEEVRQNLLIQKVRQNIRSKISVSDTELKEFYAQSHSDKDLAYAVLPAEKEIANLTVTEDEMKLLYPKIKHNFLRPEEVSLNYLFFPKEKEELLKQVMAEKSDLESLSKKYVLPILESGSFSKSDKTASDLPDELKRIAFTTELNKESDWIHLDKGSYKIKVIKKNPARDAGYEEVKDKLSQLVLKEKAIEAQMKRMNDLKKKIDQDGFEIVLKNAGIEVKNFTGYKAGSSLPELAKSTQAGRVISELKEGQVSDPVPFEDGVAIIKCVKSISTVGEDFEKNKDSIRQEILDKKTTEAMDALLANLRSRLKIDLETMKKIFELGPSDEEE